jgi:hypothetical protein
MCKPIVLAASVLCSLLAVVGQSSAQVASVPPQLQAAIKKVRGDAEIIRRDEIDLKSCEPPEGDQMVEADFNGDGRADYAALLRLGKKGSGVGPVWLTVFLAQRDGSFRSIVLDRHGNRKSTGLANLVIALRHPGVIDEVVSSRQVRLTLPGVERFWCESSATVFFWSKSAAHFESVWTGD